jgi:hypothetical protein
MKGSGGASAGFGHVVLIQGGRMLYALGLDIAFSSMRFIKDEE